MTNIQNFTGSHALVLTIYTDWESDLLSVCSMAFPVYIQTKPTDNTKTWDRTEDQNVYNTCGPYNIPQSNATPMLTTAESLVYIPCAAVLQRVEQQCQR